MSILRRVLVLVSISTVIVWFLSPVKLSYVYGIVLAIGVLLYHFETNGDFFKIFTNTTKRDNKKIVSLDEFRRKKSKQNKNLNKNQSEQWVPVYESPVIIEVDLIVAMLENQGVSTYILNRQNASILPINELTVKILVAKEDEHRALRFIQKHQHYSSNGPPSKPTT